MYDKIRVSILFFLRICVVLISFANNFFYQKNLRQTIFFTHLLCANNVFNSFWYPSVKNNGPSLITIFSIFFSLNYSKNVSIVSRSFIFSTFGIQTLSHFIKSLCVIKNSKNKTWRSTTCIFTLIERNFKLLWFYFIVLTECPVRTLLTVCSRFQLGWTFKV